MASISANGQIRMQHRPGSGQHNNKKEQSEKRTLNTCANGFLKQSFLPVTDIKLPGYQKIAVLESHFFSSLNNLSTLYGFEHIDVSKKVFPYNIYLAHEHAQRMIYNSDKNIRLSIMQDANHPATLVTSNQLDTCCTLYYVPLEPLFRVLGDKDKRRLKELLLSVYSYLYQTIQMPICDRGSFIGNNYEMIRDWIDQEPGEWEEEEYLSKLAEIDATFRVVETIRENICKPIHLRKFPTRLQAFVPSSTYESKLLEVAVKIHDLFTKYPFRSFFDNIKIQMSDPEVEERVFAEQYFSFYWQTGGWLCDTLIDNVNSTLQEMQNIDEPVAFQYFHTPQKEISHELAFEKQLLDILKELIDALNDL